MYEKCIGIFPAPERYAGIDITLPDCDPIGGTIIIFVYYAPVVKSYSSAAADTELITLNAYNVD